MGMSQVTWCNNVECGTSCNHCITGSYWNLLEDVNNCLTSNYLLPLESYSCTSGTTGDPLGWQVPDSKLFPNVS